MEKETAKQAKIEEKRRIKMEKELEKQVKKDRKKRIKEEEELIREVKLEEKKQIKSKKKDTKKKVSKNYEKSPKKEVELDVNLGKIKVDINKFGEIVEKIIERNSLRPYPDINNIPN